jgi:predicted RNase H-like nuclease
LSGTRVAGVDGTKGGWIAIVLDDERVVEDFLLRPIETDFGELAGAEVIAVDIPIGFGPRKADAAARAFVRGAASTVFPTPARELLESPFAPGRGISKQSHSLGPRILHVTGLAREDPRFYEVHPEVSFRAMNDGEALVYRKKWAAGALERVGLLRRHGIDLGRLSPAVAAAPLDDVLDAAAAAWSARRIARGEARTLPEPAEIVDGQRVAIWY